MRINVCLILVLCLSTALAYEDVTLVEYVNARSFIYFQNMIRDAGLTQILSQTGPYTLFVPTDAAFAALGQDVINGYTSVQLRSILKYHIVDSYLLLPMVSGRQNYSTLLGEPMLIESSKGEVMLNGIATVSSASADSIVNNGVVQTIDTVLMPPGPYLTGTTLAQVLVMRDDIFKDILLAFMFGEMLNILETGEFTMFATTDKAFLKYREQILRPNEPEEDAHYQDFLKYSIVPGIYKLEDLTDGLKLFTLQGNSITITNNATGVFADFAKITDPDIFAANGFIHGVDDIMVAEDYRDLLDDLRR